jgi:multisubunit Na+/H+ antiporter MnhC subunit
MNPAHEIGWRGMASLLLKSYVGDLRKWSTRLAVGYGAATAMLAGGVLTLFAAIAVGVTAIFHLIERLSGTDVAYASIGGGLFVLGVLLLLGGWAMLRRRTPPLPHRQAQVARRMIAGRAMVGLSRAEAVKADPVTQALIGAAAIMLAAWLLASRVQSSPQGRQVRR